MAAQAKPIITDLEVGDLQKLQQTMGAKVLIIKFGAEWCGPCKRIAPFFYQFVNNSPDTILFADIDVDESMNLYMALKRYKMLTGIPVFLAFFGDVKRPDGKWYIPDDSVIGADEKQVGDFFTRCVTKANSMSATGGYSYFT
jgi:thiol-disulfide isomerase/thioredoxin